MARLFLTPGQVFDTIGGNSVTDVFGTPTGNETVFVSAVGKAVFDPSFNRGGDTINIGGIAGSYTAQLSGSNIVLVGTGASAGASITIPVGTTGATVVFADATGRLVTVDNNGVVKLGTQTITTTATALLPGTVPPVEGITFNLVASTIPPGVDVMRLTGDQDVRIDFTANANQIKGLDLDGDGVIENNGIENAPDVTKLDDGKDFEVVDAYLRNRLNLGDVTKNFLGNIAFDGTGNDGDGVTTNGNIFLGGLGADTAFGGDGNDFLVGGGVFAGRPTPTGTQDTLSGVRNADFFFAEFSTLDFADGDTLRVDGGSTTDDSAVGNNTPQDSDWFLVEAQDDEEPFTINLSNEGSQTITAGAGSSTQTVGKLAEIENIDASGNLYGFLDNVDVSLGEGGKKVNGENVGIGSTAQLAIIGSVANNIFVGGLDNDRIDGLEGGDILLGGNLKYNNNPNSTGIVNDGGDELYGGAGDDSIVFEADGGVIEGDTNSAAAGNGVGPFGDGNDSLYLTKYSTGTKTAADLTTDGVLRFDLQAQNVDNAAGYGGADSKGSAAGSGATTGTQDQTNYKAGATRVDVRDMDNVIATGLGAIDYRAAGSNTAADLTFRNQQNQLGYSGKLDLRGNDGDNVLYASQGVFDDKLEGRFGDDKLSGGDGSDDFIFATLNGDAGVGANEGLDTVWRQQDNNGDNLWDTDANGDVLYTKDFGQTGPVISQNSKLTLTLDDLLRDDLQDFPVNGLTFKLDGTQYTVTLTSGIQSTYANFTAGLNAALDANATLAPLNAVLNGDQTITITDPSGRTFAPIGFTFVNNTVPAVGNLKFSQVVGAPQTSQSFDRLLFTAYEDRADGEKVNDNATSGSVISLGTDGYANDRVVGFGADGTRIAENQQYVLTFNNITTQDVVTVNVNGVTYSVTVGVDADGNAIAAEDSASGATQEDIQTAALARLAFRISNFGDDDSSAGSITAGSTATDPVTGNATLTLNQDAYAGDETVFMNTPIVTLSNTSGGQPATVLIDNASDHDVLLYQYDGRNNGLNSSNTLFIGDTGITRAVLETAKNAGGALTGLDAKLVDDLADDVQGTVFNSTSEVIINNQAASSALGTTQIFSVHGDDLLYGGDGNDTITGGTGDDRVVGSKGTDTANGGKDYYRVDVAGEAQARVYLLNSYEAATLTIPGQIINSITPVVQTQSGTAVTALNGVNSTVTKQYAFTDVLTFQQSDFTPGVSNFTVNLFNNVGDILYNTTTGLFGMVKGGAGTVTTDVDGNGTTDATTTYQEFENIRTVSGVGNAVAGSGQGNDTLILTTVSDLSTTGPADAGGVSYDLTNRGTAGQVNYSTDKHGNVVRPVQGDFDSLLMTVDGVENVITGKGDDLLMIDETEAPKNNTFSAGLGDDRIEYLNTYFAIAPGTPLTAEPVVTIKVGTGNTDTVTMTGGRLGSIVATDTLIDVEIIALNGNTARSDAAADVLDMTAFTTGAIFNYADPALTATYGTAYGSVRDLAGNLQLVVENSAQLENVWGDGNDTVIVGDSGVMNTNAQIKNTNDPISFQTFLDFDTLVTPGTNNARLPFGSQTAGQREQVDNEFLFTFSLSKVGTDLDIDTVDYSQANDDIVLVVELDTTKDQFVAVDGNAAGTTVVSGDFSTSTEDRVDRLNSVERVVASASNSILDFTNVKTGTEIKFSAFDVTKQVAALDRDVYTVLVSDLLTASPLQRGFVEYRDAGLSGTTNQATAVWTGIEGGDAAERVILNSAHSFDNMTINLRGGANEIKYNELTRSITASLSLTDFVAANPLATGLIQGTVTFQDGNGVPLPLGGSHSISSYTAGNGIASGSLRIAASQDAEDTVGFTGAVDKLIILAEVGTTDNQITVKIPEGAALTNNSLILTGFERFQDAASNDLYDIRNLNNAFLGLKLLDNAANDHDAIKLTGTGTAAGINFNGAGLSDIDLDNISSNAGGLDLDFDVLDVTAVTGTNLNLRGGTNAAGGTPDGDTTDELVLGALSIIGTGTTSDFESIVLTQASVAAGTTFELDTTANTLKQGATTYSIGAGANTVSFGGLALEGELRNSYVANATSGVTVTTKGTEAVTLIGGDGNDSLTGSSNNDLLIGGKGNDTLNGGSAVGETQSFTISVGNLASDDGYRIFNGGDFIEVTGSGGANATGFALGAGYVKLGAAVVDEDSIGAALDAVSLTNLALALNTGPIVSTTYDSVTNLFTIVFAGSEVNSTTAVAANAGGIDPATTITASAVTVVNDGGLASGDDSYGFEASAVLNGLDTVNSFDANDNLGFTLFFSKSTYGAFDEIEATIVNRTTNGSGIDATGDVVRFDNQGTALTAADIAAETAANQAIAGAISSVILEIDQTAVGENAKVWFLNDADANGTISAAEVIQIATITGAGDIIQAGNFQVF